MIWYLDVSFFGSSLVISFAGLETLLLSFNCIESLSAIPTCLGLIVDCSGVEVETHSGTSRMTLQCFYCFYCFKPVLDDFGIPGCPTCKEIRMVYGMFPGMSWIHIESWQQAFSDVYEK